MTSVLILLSGFDPGTYFIEDDGDPNNGIAQLRGPDGSVIFFNIPTEFLTVTASAGRSVVFNLTESFGAADINVGNLTNSAENPDFIQVANIAGAGDVLLASNSTITEFGSDAASDITATSLILSAATGVGTGANALETQVGTIEAETVTGGINIGNFGNLTIGGLTDEVVGLDVETSGNLTLTNFGTIVLSEQSPGGFESIHGGNTSGNVTLIANGFDSDIVSNVDQDSIAAPGGNILLQAGRDVSFGTLGASFDNDVRARGSLTINAGRDLNVDGFADLASNAFGAGTGGDVVVNAGRDVNILNSTGTDGSLGAEGTGGGDTILTAGPGGFVRLLAGSTATLFSSTGNVLVTTDRLIINGTSGITAGNGTVSIITTTAGWNIDLGSVTDGAFALEISDAELDRIFTPDLFIGDNRSGFLTVSSAISPAAATDLFLRSGTNINVNASLTVTGALSLRANDNVFQFAASVITAAGAVTVEVDSPNDDLGLGNTAILNGTITAASNSIFGAADNDTLNGTGGDNTIRGFEGADTLRGFGGNDLLAGGAGADVLIGGLGTDTADYTGNFGGVSVNLQTGVGQFNFAQGDTYSEIENVVGTDFNDILTGNDFANVLVGRSGDDTMSGGGDVDVLNGNVGNDTLNGGLANDTLNGNENNDSLFGDAGLDALNGGDGDDLLSGGADADALSGGLGVDTASYAGNFGGVSVNLQTGTGLFNFAQGDTYIDIENAAGTDFADILRGNAGVNRLEGNAQNDQLFGQAGADVLDGGLGADALDGGTEFDIADYAGEFGAVSVNLVTGSGQFNAAEGDTYVAVEGANGTEFGDILTGNNGVNVLNGNGGNDTVTGGMDADIMSGGDGLDTLTYAGNFGGVSVNLQTGAGLFNFAQGDVLSGFENVIGTEFADILTGDGGNNRLEGNGQNDQLNGGGGNDTLRGGAGADALNGGTDVDTADYSGEFGGVSINLATGTGLFNSAQGDTLTGIEKVIGTSFGDIFESNNLANIFTGGGGNDQFIFNAGFSQDTITDFVGNGAAAGDTVRFAAGLFADFADMISKSAQVGSDVVITLDASNTLTLQSTTLASLDSSDFFYA